jgi:hypothetical protein
MSNAEREAKRIKNRDAVRRCRANKKQEYEKAQARLRQEPPRYVINNDMLADAILHLNHHQSPMLHPQFIIQESKEPIPIPPSPLLVREMAVQTEMRVENQGLTPEKIE